MFSRVFHSLVTMLVLVSLWHCSSATTGQPDSGSRSSSEYIGDRPSSVDAGASDKANQDVTLTERSAPDQASADRNQPDAAEKPSPPDTRAPERVIDEATARDEATRDNAPPEPMPDTSGPQGFCPPLPAPKPGITVIRVTPKQAKDLPKIVANAAAGTTILLADGVYKMQGNESQRRIQIKKPDITLRSASGNAEKVVIDGEYKTLEGISVAGDRFTIADLTLTRVRFHLIHIVGQPNKQTVGTRIYNVRFIDAGQQFIKANGQMNSKTKIRYYTDDTQVACSYFRLTPQGRKKVEERYAGALPCYTGGIDTHGGWKWVVRDNRFEDIYCTNGGLSEHAIHFWSQSRDVTVERNVIRNCARGIGFGLGEKSRSRNYPDKPTAGISGYVGHIGGIIRNNSIYVSATPQIAKWCDTGIELAQAIKVRIYHNTVGKHTFSAIDYRFSNTRVEIRNNIVWGRITRRNNAQGTVDTNLANPAQASFRDAKQGNYRLTSQATAAIDKGKRLKESGVDIDGNTRDLGKGPDLGAFEYKPKP